MPTYTARRGWQRVLQARIPTLLGLGILILGVVAGIVLLGQGTTGFLPRASEETAPKNIRITNITDTGFSVSFVTDMASPGYVEYGTAPNRTNIQVRDDRDQLANSAGSFTTHHVTIRGLSPTTQYYFRIGTGTRQLYDNNGQPFAVRTARPISAAADAKTAYGTVSTEVGNPADGTIVYLTIQGASPLSAQVKSDGTWALPLSTVRSLDLSSSMELQESTSVQIDLQGNRPAQTLRLDTTVGALSPVDLLQFGVQPQSGVPSPSPDPTMTTTGTDLGDGVSVTPGDSTTSTDTTTSTGSFSEFISDTDQNAIAPVGGVDIRLQQNEVLTVTQPEFQGKAPAGQYIQIEVHSETPYYGAVQANTAGDWAWSPPADLEPGPHTITVTFVDENGQQQRVQRNFIVQAGGESSVPSFVSTPSASTATPTPTPVPTATPTPLPTATPVATPVSSPVATVSSSVPVATTQAQPVSGAIGSTFGMVLTSVLFFGLGGGATAWVWAKREE